MTNSAWRWFAAAGAVTVGVYPFTDGLAPRAISFGTALAAAVVMLLAVRLHRLPRPLPWLLLAAGTLGLWFGDAIWIYYDYVLQVEPFPSPADASYLAGYVALAAGLGVLVRRRTPTGSRASLLDACIITVGVGVVAWVFLLVPAATDPELDLTGRAIAVAYPMADLLLLSLAVRLSLTPGGRSTAFRLLAGGLFALLAADALYAMANLSGAETGVLPKTVWLISYVLLGTAALHPSIRTVDEAAHESAASLTRGRLALLAGASLIAPATLAAQELSGAQIHGLAIAAASALLFLLVVLRMSGLVHQVQAQAARLAAVARTDALTGAANRRAWDELLPDALVTAQRTGQPLCVALVDVDHFKAYNDTLGHAAGDILLRDAVSAWQAELRVSDLIARYGGEEFGLLLPGCTHEQAVRLLDRLRTATPGGQTCSAGVAVWDTAETAEQLLARADAALYTAKRTGRDRVELAAAAPVAG